MFLKLFLSSAIIALFMVAGGARLIANLILKPKKGPNKEMDEYYKFLIVNKLFYIEKAIVFTTYAISSILCVIFIWLSV